MESIRHKLGSQWSALAYRERLMLVGCGLMIVLFVLIQFALLPINRSISEKRSSIEQKRQVLKQMTVLHASYPRTTTTVANPKTHDRASLISLIEKSARDADLAKFIQNLAPINRGQEVRLSINDVVFNDFLLWLHDLEKVGVKAQTANVQRLDAGKSNIQMTLGR